MAKELCQRTLYQCTTDFEGVSSRLFGGWGDGMVTELQVSAYIPAKRKAARTPVMECIRQTNGIKVDAKHIKIDAVTAILRPGDPGVKTLKTGGGTCSIIFVPYFECAPAVCSIQFFCCRFETGIRTGKVVTDFDIGLDTKNMDDRGNAGIFEKLKTTKDVTGKLYQS